MLGFRLPLRPFKESRGNRNGNGNESRRLSMDVEHGYLTTFIQ
jgi:hypothetical protein